MGSWLELISYVSYLLMAVMFGQLRRPVWAFCPSSLLDGPGLFFREETSVKEEA